MTKRPYILSALIFAGVLLVVINGATAQTPTMLREEFHQSYPISPTGRISLENIQGSVRVTSWDRNEVKVDAIKTAYTKERMAEAQIKIDATADLVRIKTSYPFGDLNFTGDDDGRYRNPASVEYTLTVPRNARIDSIELINGDLTIEGIAGDTKGSSINGRVQARKLTGTVKLSTINGTLEATFEALDDSKPIALGSVNGQVVLIIPSDANAILRAGTVFGGIKNDFGLPVRRGDYVGRELAGQLGRGGARIKLANVNGGINIQHAADGRTLSPATSLLAEGSSGDDEDWDWDDDSDKAGKSASKESARAAREAQREAARARMEAQRAQVAASRAQVDAKRAEVQAQREAQRAVQDAQREAVAATRAAQVDAQRAPATATAQTQRAIARAARTAQAEGQRAAREAQREIERAQVEIERSVEDQVRVYGSGAYRLVEREQKSFAVTGAPSITVATFDGAIVVRAWDKPEVSVNAIKRASNENSLKGIRIEAVQRGAEITIRADFDNKFAEQVAPGVTNVNAMVNLELFVPRNVILRATSGDGRLVLEGVGGDIQLRTEDGSVDVVDGKGTLLVNTNDGRIRIANFDGSADARTDDGRIVLDGKFINLSARTGDGSITLVVPATFSAIVETDAEKLYAEGLNAVEETPPGKGLRRWKIGNGGKVITLRTGDGRIVIRGEGGQ